MKVFAELSEVLASKGAKLGVSSWQLVDQARIDLFADATGDHQWIHVDPERAATGPFGGTIAHGYLTLSMLPGMMQELVSYAFDPVRVNYGLEKVRFMTPVPVDSRLRDSITIHSVESVAAGTRVVFEHRVEVEGLAKPACVAQTVSLLVD